MVVPIPILSPSLKGKIREPVWIPMNESTKLQIVDEDSIISVWKSMVLFTYFF